MKKNMIAVIFIIGLSCLAIYYLSRKDFDQKPNAFSRKFVNVKLKLINATELPERYYFAGLIDQNIPLMYPEDKLNLYQLSLDFKKIDTLKIYYPSSFYSKAVNIYKHVAPPNIVCSNPYGDILVANGNKSGTYKFLKFRFDFSQSISRNSLIVRVRDSNNKSLAKLVLTHEVNMNKRYTFPSSVNGAIANDGILLHDKQLQRIFYMYYYRGEFLCLDTNLNLLYKAKTIDTVRTSNTKFKIVDYKDEQTKKHKQIISQTSPPKIVNSYLTTYNGKVYVISMLKSDNDIDAKFSLNQVIDVYSIKNGSYLHSFYVPKHLGKRLRQFQITGNTLTGLNGKYIVQYKFTE